MRLDAQIDKRQVICPNSSTTGYSHRIARVGAVIHYTECGVPRIGKMIGRVHYAPALEHTPAVRDHILCIVLSGDMSFVMERWVNPADVTAVHYTVDYSALYYLLSNAPVTEPLEDVRTAASELWSTVQRYQEFRDKRRTATA